MLKQALKYNKIIVCVLLVSFNSSSNKEIEEYNAKALFIYNFTKYIEWSNSDEFENFTIAVYRKCDIIEPLKELANSKKIQNKKINISVIKGYDQELNCQVLFLPEFVSIESYINILKKLNRKNSLIISENKKLFQRGTMINFLIVDDKIKFEINMKSIESAGLKISSQLLKLATSVKQE